MEPVRTPNTIDTARPYAVRTTDNAKPAAAKVAVAPKVAAALQDAEHREARAAYSEIAADAADVLDLAASLAETIAGLDVLDTTPAAAIEFASKLGQKIVDLGNAQLKEVTGQKAYTSPRAVTIQQQEASNSQAVLALGTDLAMKVVTFNLAPTRPSAASVLQTCSATVQKLLALGTAQAARALSMRK